MTHRPIPDFLKQGDKPLGFPHPTPEQRMRGMMEMPDPETPVQPFVRRK